MFGLEELLACQMWGKARYLMLWWDQLLLKRPIFHFVQLVGLNVFVSAQPHFLLNYRHTEPNVGLVNVPDKRLDELAIIHKSENVVPAVVGLIHASHHSHFTRRHLLRADGIC